MNRSLIPQFAFWGLCAIALIWSVMTLLFECHLGWPVGGAGWAKRLVGWSVEAWFIRTLLLGVRRYYSPSGS